MAQRVVRGLVFGAGLAMLAAVVLCPATAEAGQAGAGQAGSGQVGDRPAPMRPQTSADRGIAAFERADWAQAEREFIAALKQDRASNSPPDNLLIALENLALTRERRQNRAGAEALREEALAIRRKRDGDTHVDTLEAMMQLGYARQAGRSDAAPLFLQVLRARQVAKDWAGASAASIALAYSRASAGRFAEADHAANAALDLAVRSGDAETERVALLGRGDVFSQAGRYAEAEASALQALERLPAEALPMERVRIFGALATARRQQGEYVGAAAAQTEVIRILEGEGETVRPILGGALNDLGIVRDHQGRLTDAEFLYRRALDLTVDPAERAATTSNLGWNLHQQERHPEAERLLREAAMTYDRVRGRADPDGASAWTNLAGELQSQGRDAEALPIFRDALARYEKTLGRGHATVGWTLNAMARSIAATGGAVEAETLFREALRLSETRRPPGHPEISTQAGDLADLLVRTDRATEALPLLRRVGGEVLDRTGAEPEQGAGSDARRALDRDRRLFRLHVAAAWAAG